MMTKNGKNSWMRKVCACLTLCFFLSSEAGAAAPALGPALPAFDASLLAANPFGIRLDESEGRVASYYTGDAGMPLIVHIQDAHANISAQKNIQNIILKTLPEVTGGPVFVLLEGAEGPVTTAQIGAFLKAGYDPRGMLLEKGMINGPELAALMNPDIVLWGIEDSGLYRENLEAWEAATSSSAENLKFIGDFRERVEAVLHHRSRPEMRLLQKAAKALESEDGSLSDVSGYLKKFIRILRRELSAKDTEKLISAGDLKDRYPNVYRFMQLEYLWQDARDELARAAERQVSQTANRQRERRRRADAKFADNLLPAPERVAAASTADLKNGTGTAIELLPPALGEYSGFRGRASSLAQNLTEKVASGRGTSSLDKYLRVTAQVDPYLFHEEIRLLIADLKANLPVDEKIRQLDLLYEKSLLLEKLAGLALAPQEYERLRELGAWEKYELLRDYENLTGEKGFRISGNWNPAGAIHFYQAAVKRDAALTSNLLDFIKRHKSAAGIYLYTGGFHAPGISHRLRQSDISYVSIQPALESIQENDDKRYRSALNWLLSAVAVLTASARNTPALVQQLALPFIAGKIFTAGGDMQAAERIYQESRTALIRFYDQTVLENSAGILREPGGAEHLTQNRRIFIEGLDSLEKIFQEISAGRAVMEKDTLQIRYQGEDWLIRPEKAEPVIRREVTDSAGENAERVEHDKAPVKPVLLPAGVASVAVEWAGKWFAGQRSEIRRIDPAEEKERIGADDYRVYKQAGFSITGYKFGGQELRYDMMLSFPPDGDLPQKDIVMIQDARTSRSAIHVFENGSDEGEAPVENAAGKVIHAGGPALINGAQGLKYQIYVQYAPVFQGIAPEGFLYGSADTPQGIPYRIEFVNSGGEVVPVQAPSPTSGGELSGGRFDLRQSVPLMEGFLKKDLRAGRYVLDEARDFWEKQGFQIRLESNGDLKIVDQDWRTVAWSKAVDSTAGLSRWLRDSDEEVGLHYRRQSGQLFFQNDTVEIGRRTGFDHVVEVYFMPNNKSASGKREYYVEVSAWEELIDQKMEGIATELQENYPNIRLSKPEGNDDFYLIEGENFKWIIFKTGDAALPQPPDTFSYGQPHDLFLGENVFSSMHDFFLYALRSAEQPDSDFERSIFKDEVVSYFDSQERLIRFKANYLTLAIDGVGMWELQFDPDGVEVLSRQSLTSGDIFRQLFTPAQVRIEYTKATETEGKKIRIVARVSADQLTALKTTIHANEGRKFQFNPLNPVVEGLKFDEYFTWAFTDGTKLEVVFETEDMPDASLPSGGLKHPGRTGRQIYEEVREQGIFYDNTLFEQDQKRTLQVLPYYPVEDQPPRSYINTANGITTIEIRNDQNVPRSSPPAFRYRENALTGQRTITTEKVDSYEMKPNEKFDFKIISTGGSVVYYVMIPDEMYEQQNQFQFSRAENVLSDVMLRQTVRYFSESQVEQTDYLQKIFTTSVAGQIKPVNKSEIFETDKVIPQDAYSVNWGSDFKRVFSELEKEGFEATRETNQSGEINQLFPPLEYPTFQGHRIAAITSGAVVPTPFTDIGGSFFEHPLLNFLAGITNDLDSQYLYFSSVTLGGWVEGKIAQSNEFGLADFNDIEDILFVPEDPAAGRKRQLFVILKRRAESGLITAAQFAATLRGFLRKTQFFDEHQNDRYVYMESQTFKMVILTSEEAAAWRAATTAPADSDSDGTAVLPENSGGSVTHYADPRLSDLYQLDHKLDLELLSSNAFSDFSPKYKVAHLVAFLTRHFGFDVYQKDYETLFLYQPNFYPYGQTGTGSDIRNGLLITAIEDAEDFHIESAQFRIPEAVEPSHYQTTQAMDGFFASFLKSIWVEYDAGENKIRAVDFRHLDEDETFEHLWRLMTFTGESRDVSQAGVFNDRWWDAQRVAYEIMAPHAAFDLERAGNEGSGQGGDPGTSGGGLQDSTPFAIDYAAINRVVVGQVFESDIHNLADPGISPEEISRITRPENLFPRIDAAMNLEDATWAGFTSIVAVIYNARLMNPGRRWTPGLIAFVQSLANHPHLSDRFRVENLDRLIEIIAGNSAESTPSVPSGSAGLRTSTDYHVDLGGSLMGRTFQPVMDELLSDDLTIERRRQLTSGDFIWDLFHATRQADVGQTDSSDLDMIAITIIHSLEKNNRTKLPVVLKKFLTGMLESPAIQERFHITRMDTVIDDVVNDREPGASGMSASSAVSDDVVLSPLTQALLDGIGVDDDDNDELPVPVNSANLVGMSKGEERLAMLEAKMAEFGLVRVAAENITNPEKLVELFRHDAEDKSPAGFTLYRPTEMDQSVTVLFGIDETNHTLFSVSITYPQWPNVGWNNPDDAIQFQIHSDEMTPQKIDDMTQAWYEPARNLLLLIRSGSTIFELDPDYASFRISTLKMKKLNRDHLELLWDEDEVFPVASAADGNSGSSPPLGPDQPASAGDLSPEDINRLFTIKDWLEGSRSVYADSDFAMLLDQYEVQTSSVFSDDTIYHLVIMAGAREMSALHENEKELLLGDFEAVAEFIDWHEAAVPALDQSFHAESELIDAGLLAEAYLTILDRLNTARAARSELRNMNPAEIAPVIGAEDFRMLPKPGFTVVGYRFGSQELRYDFHMFFRRAGAPYREIVIVEDARTAGGSSALHTFTGNAPESERDVAPSQGKVFHRLGPAGFGTQGKGMIFEIYENYRASFEGIDREGVFYDTQSDSDGIPYQLVFVNSSGEAVADEPAPGSPGLMSTFAELSNAKKWEAIQAAGQLTETLTELETAPSGPAILWSEGRAESGIGVSNDMRMLFKVSSERIFEEMAAMEDLESLWEGVDLMAGRFLAFRTKERDQQFKFILINQAGHYYETVFTDGVNPVNLTWQQHVDEHKLRQVDVAELLSRSRAMRSVPGAFHELSRDLKWIALTRLITRHLPQAMLEEGNATTAPRIILDPFRGRYTLAPGPNGRLGLYYNDQPLKVIRYYDLTSLWIGKNDSGNPVVGLSVLMPNPFGKLMNEFVMISEDEFAESKAFVDLTSADGMQWGAFLERYQFQEIDMESLLTEAELETAEKAVDPDGPRPETSGPVGLSENFADLSQQQKWEFLIQAIPAHLPVFKYDQDQNQLMTEDEVQEIFVTADDEFYIGYFVTKHALPRTEDVLSFWVNPETAEKRMVVLYTRVPDDGSGNVISKTIQLYEEDPPKIRRYVNGFDDLGNPFDDLVRGNGLREVTPAEIFSGEPITQTASDSVVTDTERTDQEKINRIRQELENAGWDELPYASDTADDPGNIRLYFPPAVSGESKAVMLSSFPARLAIVSVETVQVGSAEGAYAITQGHEARDMKRVSQFLLHIDGTAFQLLDRQNVVPGLLVESKGGKLEVREITNEGIGGNDFYPIWRGAVNAVSTPSMSSDLQKVRRVILAKITDSRLADITLEPEENHKYDDLELPGDPVNFGVNMHDGHPIVHVFIYETGRDLFGGSMVDNINALAEEIAEALGDEKAGLRFVHVDEASYPQNAALSENLSAPSENEPAPANPAAPQPGSSTGLGSIGPGLNLKEREKITFKGLDGRPIENDRGSSTNGFEETFFEPLPGGKYGVLVNQYALFQQRLYLIDMETMQAVDMVDPQRDNLQKIFAFFRHDSEYVAFETAFGAEGADGTLYAGFGFDKAPAAMIYKIENGRFKPAVEFGSEGFFQYQDREAWWNTGHPLYRHDGLHTFGMYLNPDGEWRFLVHEKGSGSTSGGGHTYDVGLYDVRGRRVRPLVRGFSNRPSAAMDANYIYVSGNNLFVFDKNKEAQDDITLIGGPLYVPGAYDLTLDPDGRMIMSPGEASDRHGGESALFNHKSNPEKILIYHPAEKLAAMLASDNTQSSAETATIQNLDYFDWAVGGQIPLPWHYRARYSNGYIWFYQNNEGSFYRVPYDSNGANAVWAESRKPVRGSPGSLRAVLRGMLENSPAWHKVGEIPGQENFINTRDNRFYFFDDSSFYVSLSETAFYIHPDAPTGPAGGRRYSSDRNYFEIDSRDIRGVSLSERARNQEGVAVVFDLIFSVPVSEFERYADLFKDQARVQIDSNAKTIIFKGKMKDEYGSHVHLVFKDFGDKNSGASRPDSLIGLVSNDNIIFRNEDGVPVEMFSQVPSEAIELNGFLAMNPADPKTLAWWKRFFEQKPDNNREEYFSYSGYKAEVGFNRVYVTDSSGTEILTNRAGEKSGHDWIFHSDLARDLPVPLTVETHEGNLIVSDNQGFVTLTGLDNLLSVDMVPDSSRRDYRAVYFTFEAMTDDLRRNFEQVRSTFGEVPFAEVVLDQDRLAIKAGATTYVFQGVETAAAGRPFERYRREAAPEAWLNYQSLVQFEDEFTRTHDDFRNKNTIAALEGSYYIRIYNRKLKDDKEEKTRLYLHADNGWLLQESKDGRTFGLHYYGRRHHSVQVEQTVTDDFPGQVSVSYLEGEKDEAQREVIIRLLISNDTFEKIKRDYGDFSRNFTVEKRDDDGRGIRPPVSLEEWLAPFDSPYGHHIRLIIEADGAEVLNGTSGNNGGDNPSGGSSGSGVSAGPVQGLINGLRHYYQPGEFARLLDEYEIDTQTLLYDTDLQPLELILAAGTFQWSVLKDSEQERLEEGKDLILAFADWYKEKHGAAFPAYVHPLHDDSDEINWLILIDRLMGAKTVLEGLRAARSELRGLNPEEETVKAGADDYRIYPKPGFAVVGYRFGGQDLRYDFHMTFKTDTAGIREFVATQDGRSQPMVSGFYIFDAEDKTETALENLSGEFFRNLVPADFGERGKGMRLTIDAKYAAYFSGIPAAGNFYDRVQDKDGIPYQILFVDETGAEVTAPADNPSPLTAPSLVPEEPSIYENIYDSMEAFGEAMIAGVGSDHPLFTGDGNDFDYTRDYGEQTKLVLTQEPSRTYVGFNFYETGSAGTLFGYWSINENIAGADEYVFQPGEDNDDTRIEGAAKRIEVRHRRVKKEDGEYYSEFQFFLEMDAGAAVYFRNFQKKYLRIEVSGGDIIEFVPLSEADWDSRFSESGTESAPEPESLSLINPTPSGNVIHNVFDGLNDWISDIELFWFDSGTIFWSDDDDPTKEMYSVMLTERGDELSLSANDKEDSVSLHLYKSIPASRDGDVAVFKTLEWQLFEPEGSKPWIAFMEGDYRAGTFQVNEITVVEDRWHDVVDYTSHVKVFIRVDDDVKSALAAGIFADYLRKVEGPAGIVELIPLTESEWNSRFNSFTPERGLVRLENTEVFSGASGKNPLVEFAEWLQDDTGGAAPAAGQQLVSDEQLHLEVDLNVPETTSDIVHDGVLIAWTANGWALRHNPNLDDYILEYVDLFAPGMGMVNSVLLPFKAQPLVTLHHSGEKPDSKNPQPFDLQIDLKVSEETYKQLEEQYARYRTEYEPGHPDSAVAKNNLPVNLSGWLLPKETAAGQRVILNIFVDGAASGSRGSGSVLSQKSFDEIFDEVPDWERELIPNDNYQAKSLANRDIVFRTADPASDNAYQTMNMILIHGEALRNRIYISKEKTIFMYLLYTSAPEIDSGAKPVVVELAGEHLVDVVYEENPRAMHVIVSEEFMRAIENGDFSQLPFVSQKDKEDAYDWQGKTEEDGILFSIVGARDYAREHPEWKGLPGDNDDVAVQPSQVGQAFREIGSIRDIVAYMLEKEKHGFNPNPNNAAFDDVNNLPNDGILDWDQEGVLASSIRMFLNTKEVLFFLNTGGERPDKSRGIRVHWNPFKPDDQRLNVMTPGEVIQQEVDVAIPGVIKKIEVPDDPARPLHWRFYLENVPQGVLDFLQRKDFDIRHLVLTDHEGKPTGATAEFIVMNSEGGGNAVELPEDSGPAQPSQSPTGLDASVTYVYESLESFWKALPENAMPEFSIMEPGESGDKTSYEGLLDGEGNEIWLTAAPVFPLTLSFAYETIDEIQLEMLPMAHPRLVQESENEYRLLIIGEGSQELNQFDVQDMRIVEKVTPEGRFYSSDFQLFVKVDSQTLAQLKQIDPRYFTFEAPYGHLVRLTALDESGWNERWNLAQPDKASKQPARNLNPNLTNVLTYDTLFEFVAEQAAEAGKPGALFNESKMREYETPEPDRLANGRKRNLELYAEADHGVDISYNFSEPFGLTAGASIRADAFWVLRQKPGETGYVRFLAYVGAEENVLLDEDFDDGFAVIQPIARAGDPEAAHFRFFIRVSAASAQKLEEEFSHWLRREQPNGDIIEIVPVITEEWERVRQPGKPVDSDPQADSEEADGQGGLAQGSNIFTYAGTIDFFSKLKEDNPQSRTLLQEGLYGNAGARLTGFENKRLDIYSLSQISLKTFANGQATLSFDSGRQEAAASEGNNKIWELTESSRPGFQPLLEFYEKEASRIDRTVLQKFPVDNIEIVEERIPVSAGNFTSKLTVFVQVSDDAKQAINQSYADWLYYKGTSGDEFRLVPLTANEWAAKAGLPKPSNVPFRNSGDVVDEIFRRRTLETLYNRLIEKGYFHHLIAKSYRSNDGINASQSEFFLLEFEKQEDFFASFSGTGPAHQQLVLYPGSAVSKGPEIFADSSDEFAVPRPKIRIGEDTRSRPSETISMDRNWLLYVQPRYDQKTIYVVLDETRFKGSRNEDLPEDLYYIWQRRIGPTFGEVEEWKVQYIRKSDIEANPGKWAHAFRGLGESSSAAVVDVSPVSAKPDQTAAPNFSSADSAFDGGNGAEDLDDEAFASSADGFWKWLAYVYDLDFIDEDQKITKAQLQSYLIEFDAEAVSLLTRATIRKIVRTMNEAEPEDQYPRFAQRTGDAEKWTDDLFSAVTAARSEQRSLTADESREVLSELEFASDRGFLKSYYLEPTHEIFDGLAEYARSHLSESDLKQFEKFSGDIEVVRNPVKRPDDNLFLHLDAEDILYEFDSARQAPGLGELTFNYQGKQTYALHREAGDRFGLVVRESLFNSLLTAVKTGDSRGHQALLELILIRREILPGKAAELAVRESAARESIAFVNELFRASPLKRLDQTRYLLVSENIIRRNYGIGRTINILAGLGYQIFVRENTVFKNDRDRADFYRTYQLEALAEGGILTSVYGPEVQQLQMIKQTAGRRLEPDDLITVFFEGEQLPGGFDAYSHLTLAEDLLGVTRGRRADYPVLLAGAQLLASPEEIEKLGDDYILRRAPRTWMMRATPDTLDMSSGLIQDIQNYQALAELVARAA